MDDAFERALFLIEADGLTLEDSLSGLSAADVERLRPMLEAVLAVKEQASDLPAPVERAANKARFLSEIAELRAKQAGTPGLIERLKARYKNGLASGLMRSIVATTAALALTGGVATAAGSSGPNSPFYPLKRAVETVEAAMPRSDFAQFRLHLSLAEERLAELAAERSGDSGANKQLSTEVLSELEKAKALTARLSPAEKPEALRMYAELKRRYETALESERRSTEWKRHQSEVDRGVQPAAPSGDGENTEQEGHGDSRENSPDGDSDGDSGEDSPDGDSDGDSGEDSPDGDSDGDSREDSPDGDSDGDSDSKSDSERNVESDEGSEKGENQGSVQGSAYQKQPETKPQVQKETTSSAERDRHHKKHKKRKHKKSRRPRGRAPRTSGWSRPPSYERSR